MIGLCTLSIGDGRASKKALQLSIGLMTFRLVRSPFKAVSVHSITTLDTC